MVDTEHLLAGLVRVDAELIGRCGGALTCDQIASSSARWHNPGPRIPTSRDMPCSESFQRVFAGAESVADAAKCAEVRTEHLLLAMMSESTSHAFTLLTESGITSEAAKRAAVDADCGAPQPKVDWTSFDMSDLLP